MNLTLQFLIVLTLPLSFVIMAVYSGRQGVHRPGIRWYWVLSLLVAALWASSLLSVYSGAAMPVAVSYTWKTLGRHALSLFSLLLLLTTTQYLLVPQAQTRLVVIISAILWGGALILDPAIRFLGQSQFTIAGQLVSSFDLWAAVWVTGWFIPLLAAGLLTRHAYLNAPGAIYRNQLAYWLLMLVLFGIGGVLALIQQPGEPFWQEVGILVQIGATLLGMLHLTRSQLPELRLVLRRLTGRLAGAAIIFGLSMVALLVLNEFNPARTAGSTTLYLILSAAGFTLLFMLINRVVRQLVARWLLPAAPHSRLALSSRPDIQDHLDQPDALAKMILEHVQQNLSAESGRIYLLDKDQAGRIRATTLAAIGTPPVAEATFAADSLFLQQLKHDPAGWLAQYDLDALPIFAPLAPDERAILQGWEHELFIGLPAGESLAGIMALGTKFTGEPYEDTEMAWLCALSGPAGLLLLQAHRLQSLRATTSEMRAAFQALQHHNQQLSAWQHLYHHFVQMITPELRHPLTQITGRIRQEEATQTRPIQTAADAEGKDAQEHPFAWLEEPLAALQLPLESVVAVAARLQKQETFHFSPVRIEDVLYLVQRELAGMADARRVRVEVDIPAYLPALEADESRLMEALRNLTHNAIKFNKIGGMVQINCDVVAGELCVQVADTGVGIPEEMQDTIWAAHQGQESGRFHRTTPRLGLLFTRFIVEAHGGRITVNSIHGEGSTFSVYLPLTGDE